MNDAPMLAAIGDKTATTGSPLQFKTTAADPDAGQTKTFSLISAPGSASINGNSGAFTWIPANPGSYTFKVRVTDNGTLTLFDEEAITVTVAAGLVRLNSQAPNAPKSKITGSVNLYPNPVTDQFTVVLPEPATEINTFVSNTAGEKLLLNNCQVISPDKLQVNTKQLKAGLYIFHLQWDKKREALRFIKQ